MACSCCSSCTCQTETDDLMHARVRRSIDWLIGQLGLGGARWVGRVEWMGVLSMTLKARKIEAIIGCHSYFPFRTRACCLIIRADFLLRRWPRLKAVIPSVDSSPAQSSLHSSTVEALGLYLSVALLESRGVGWPSGIGWGDNVRTAVGSSPAPPTVRVAM